LIPNGLIDGYQDVKTGLFGSFQQTAVFSSLPDWRSGRFDNRGQGTEVAAARRRIHRPEASSGKQKLSGFLQRFQG
jgi:hypothetical protein